MKIPSVVWIVLILVLGGGFLVLLSNQKNNSITAVNETLPVKVDVYVDYNCPHCADFENYVRDVKTTYGDKVDVETKNLPFLADSSITYAYASEAARMQGKFDDYSYDLFKWVSYQRDPNNTDFTYSDTDKSFYGNPVDPVQLAQKLGLDVNKFQTDMNGDEVKNIIKQEKQKVISLTGTQSTPTVLIYGKVFTLTSFGDLKTKVGDLINQIESQNNQS